jgi:hypothetical protein
MAIRPGRLVFEEELVGVTCAAEAWTPNSTRTQPALEKAQVRGSALSVFVLPPPAQAICEARGGF